MPDIRLGIVGSLSSGKSALVHRYLTGSYMQEESPEGGRFKKEVVVDGHSYLLLIRDEGGPPELQVSESFSLRFRFRAFILREMGRPSIDWFATRQTSGYASLPVGMAWADSLPGPPLPITLSFFRLMDEDVSVGVILLFRQHFPPLPTAALHLLPPFDEQTRPTDRATLF